MKKRLRKKKHCGEYTEWGRRLVATRTTEADADAFLDAFIMEAIEANWCSCGGTSSNGEIDMVVELGRMADDPDDKFAKVAAWLDARSDVSGWRAGNLFDIWRL